MRSLGFHLQQTRKLVGTPRPSAVAELDATGALASLAFASADDEVLAALGDGAAVVMLDAPLTIPEDSGMRDVERVLQWCDVPAFPVSARRVTHVHDGHRAGQLTSRIPASLQLSETLPDLALRLMAWSESHRGQAMDLADYRVAWLAVRPPRFRPKGPGRAHPSGVAAAAALLARHVDLGGWHPSEPTDDWASIRDAAAIDAIACAWVAHRAIHTPDSVVTIGTAARGEMVVPIDVNLGSRIALTVARLRSEGTIAI